MAFIKHQNAREQSSQWSLEPDKVDWVIVEVVLLIASLIILLSVNDKTKIHASKTQSTIQHPPLPSFLPSPSCWWRDCPSQAFSCQASYNQRPVATWQTLKLQSLVIHHNQTCLLAAVCQEMVVDLAKHVFFKKGNIAMAIYQQQYSNSNSNILSFLRCLKPFMKLSLII